MNDLIQNLIQRNKELKAEISKTNIELSRLNSRLNDAVRDDFDKQLADAYQRGYDKGYKDKTNNDEVCKELASEIYQRGLNDAWEFAKEIVVNMDVKKRAEVFFDSAEQVTHEEPFKHFSYEEALIKLKAYEEKQKAADAIKVGDEVISLGTEGKAIEKMSPWFVTHETKYSYQGFDAEGMSHSNPKKSVRKTGRHFDIDKILKEMQQC